MGAARESGTTSPALRAAGLSRLRHGLTQASNNSCARRWSHCVSAGFLPSAPCYEPLNGCLTSPIVAIHNAQMIKFMRQGATYLLQAIWLQYLVGGALLVYGVGTNSFAQLGYAIAGGGLLGMAAVEHTFLVLLRRKRP